MFDALLKLREESSGAHPPSIPAPFNVRARNALLKFTELLLNLRAARTQRGLPELYDLTLKLTGYRDLVQDGTLEGEERWENLMELRAVTQEFAYVPSEEGLPLFLEQVALVSDADGLNDRAAGAALLTLHAAKGLEFPVVFIVGMNEDILPHARSLGDPEAMEEERRLCYVGITRARDRLYLVHTFRHGTLGQEGLCAPSRFLRDIPEELIERRSGYMEDGLSELASSLRDILSSGDVSTPSRRGFERSISTAGSRPLSQDLPARQPRFKAGDIVMHPKFGEGVVLASHLTRDDEEIEVSFGKQGTKRLSVALAPLTKLG
jgi:DNA helicase-2/ATP-dependent DNA helicase PcrA